jgi:hypothetical protein
MKRIFPFLLAAIVLSSQSHAQNTDHRKKEHIVTAVPAGKGAFVNDVTELLKYQGKHAELKGTPIPDRKNTYTCKLGLTGFVTDVRHIGDVFALSAIKHSEGTTPAEQHANAEKAMSDIAEEIKQMDGYTIYDSQNPKDAAHFTGSAALHTGNLRQIAVFRYDYEQFKVTEDDGFLMVYFD